MVALVRHSQWKQGATDRPDLTPPRQSSTLHPIGYRGGINLYRAVMVPRGTDPMGLWSAADSQAIGMMIMYMLGFFPGFGYGFEPWWVGEDAIDLNLPNVASSPEVKRVFDGFFASEGKRLCAEKLKRLKDEAKELEKEGKSKSDCFARLISEVKYGSTFVGNVRAFPDSTVWEAVVGTSSLSFAGDAEVFIKKDPSSTPPCCKCSCTVTFSGTAQFYDEIDANSFVESYRRGGFSNLGSGAVHTIEGIVDIIGDKIFDADFNIR